MVASNLHPSFTNTGHLAISAAMEYKKAYRAGDLLLMWRLGKSLGQIYISTFRRFLQHGQLPISCVQSLNSLLISFIYPCNFRGACDELQVRGGIKVI